MRDIILYIGSIFLPDKSAGAQRALSLSKSFRDLGYRTIIVGMATGQSMATPVVETLKNCCGFETFSVAQPQNIREWFHHTISIQEFKRVIDYYGATRIFAIVAMEYEAIPLIRLSRYCRKRGIHLIADAEEWYEKSTLRFPMNIAKDVDTILRMRYVYPKKISKMICISRFFERQFAGSVAQRVYVPGTIDPEEEKWRNIDSYSPNHVFTIGYAGHPGIRFEKERLDLLIKAVLELNDEGYKCQLKIAGLDQIFIVKQLPDLHLTEAISFLGKVSHRQCLDMIATSDFSAIIREDKRVTKAGFPTKLSESFGCGTPVLATDSSNIFDYIIDGKTGVRCDGYSKDAVKRGILQAMSFSTEELVLMHSSIRAHNPLIYSRFTKNIGEFLQSLD